MEAEPSPPPCLEVGYLGGRSKKAVGVADDFQTMDVKERGGGLRDHSCSLLAGLWDFTECTIPTRM